ncbi:MAG: TolC family protein [Candidatus Kapaibacterium sp.]|nr:MAG: TolC family protein [Candidatus Kapabacteria bacterium]
MKLLHTFCLRFVMGSALVSLALGSAPALAQGTTPAQTAALQNAATPGNNIRTFTLEECLKFALGDNPEILAASGQFQEAAGRTKSAFASFLPTLSINGGYNRGLNDTTLNIFPRQNPDTKQVELAFTPFYNPEIFRNNFALNANLNYTVFNGFQRENVYAQAQASQSASDYTLSQTRRRILASVRSQYLAVMRVKQILRVRQEDFTIGKKQLERIRAQFEAGVIPIATVFTQEADLANRELAVVQAENDVELAKGTLLSTLGLNPGAAADFADLATPQTLTPSDMQAFRATVGDFSKAFSSALEKRADFAASKASLDAANAGIAVANAAWLPTVNASAGYNWNSPAVGNFQYGSQSLGINFRYLLFDGFDRDASNQRARAQVSQIEAQKRQAEQRIASDVQNGFIQLNTSEKNLDITARALKAAQQNFDAAEERFKVGAANILDLTTANANLATAKINRITALYNYLGAQYQMKFALGTLDE